VGELVFGIYFIPSELQWDTSMGLLGENFDQSDLDKYLGRYRINASSYIVPVTNIDNATNDDSIPVCWIFRKLKWTTPNFIC